MTLARASSPRVQKRLHRQEIVAALPFPIQPPLCFASEGDAGRRRPAAGAIRYSRRLRERTRRKNRRCAVRDQSAQAVESGAADEHAVLGESRLGPFRDTQPRPLVRRQVQARKGFHEAEDGVEFRIRRQRFNLPGELSWRPQIVGVDEREGVARRLGGGAVESGAHSRIRLADQEPAAPRGRQNGGRPIRRPVVDDDDLERRRRWSSIDSTASPTYEAAFQQARRTDTRITVPAHARRRGRRRARPRAGRGARGRPRATGSPHECGRSG